MNQETHETGPEVCDAIALAELIGAGELSAREAAAQAISRIKRHNPSLNAVIGTRFEQALAEIESGLPTGPLTGVPILIKDLGTEVAGLPSTGGSRLFAEGTAAQDSELVARYRRAGMVVLGTTNTPELGLNASTEPQLFGPTRNPRDLGRSPGGSSGGAAAAVASGMVSVAHGSDGGGSLRIPASMCGLFGLKPSRGRVTGSPDSGTLAAPVSVHHALTTTVRDSALLLDVVAGPLPGEAFGASTPVGTFLDATRREPGRLRIGFATAPRNGISTDPQCVEAVLAAARLCEELGHDVEEMTPAFDVEDVGAASGALMGADLVVTVEDRLEKLGRELRDDDVEPFTRILLDHYRTLSGTQVHRALRRLQEIGWEVGAAFTTYDVLLMPTLARPVPELGLLDTLRPETMYELASAYSAWTSVFNVTGMPAMSLPLAVDDRRLPMGVQFAADLGDEATLLSLAAQIERAAPWQRLAPGYDGYAG